MAQELVGASLPSITAGSSCLTVSPNPLTGTGTVDITGSRASVACGGTGLASGTSGGIPAYTASGTLTSSAALAAGGIVLGGGAGVVPNTDTNLTWDATNHALTINGATVTTSNPVLNLSQTWNAAGVTFGGIQLNVTNTASNAVSLLLDLQVGGSSKLKVDRTGFLTASGGISSSGGYFTSDATFNLAVGVLKLSSAGGLSWSSTTNYTSTNDLFLNRAAAATLQQGAADAATPVAQTTQVQSVVAGTTNTAGQNWTLAGSKGTGTGAGGAILLQTAPTGSTGTAQNAAQTVLSVNPEGVTQYRKTFTVATLPTAGTAGRKSWVSDATACTFLGTLTGGGSVQCPVHDNGSAWVGG